MILRPAHPVAAASAEPQPLWQLIERSQLEPGADPWLIPQPAHSALSGEFAARFSHPEIPPIPADILQAIALHDAGWGRTDAEAIRSVRSPGRGRGDLSALSFLKAPVAQAIAAWSGSIEAAAKVSAASGYLVSAHFGGLAQFGIEAGHYRAAAARKMKEFCRQEAERQQELRPRTGRSAEELDRLLEVLQLCDLLSLYFCCGVAAGAKLPQRLQGRPVTVEPEGAAWRLLPSPFAGPQDFSFNAIRVARPGQAGNASFAIRLV